MLSQAMIPAQYVDSLSEMQAVQPHVLHKTWFGDWELRSLSRDQTYIETWIWKCHLHACYPATRICLLGYTCIEYWKLGSWQQISALLGFISHRESVDDCLDSSGPDSSDPKTMVRISMALTHMAGVAIALIAVALKPTHSRAVHALYSGFLGTTLM